MGTSVYPVSEKHQEEMEAELKTSGLDDNLRHCEIACWKSVFKYCTNVDIDDLQWMDVSCEDVLSYNESCNQILADIASDFKIDNDYLFQYHDLVKLQTYLNIITKYGAYLVVC